MRAILQRAYDLIQRVDALRPGLRMEPSLRPPGKPFHYWLSPKTQLVRFYDHKDSQTPPRWSPLDYNPNPVKDRRRTRGRFSSTDVEAYAYMYLGEGKHALRTALWEILELQGFDGVTGEYHLPSRMIKDYAIAEMAVVKRLYLINVRNQDDLKPYHALLAAIRGDDYRLTRAWGRYFRKNSGRQIDGLRYHSTRAGYDNALVLFEPLKAESRPRTPRKLRRTKRSALLRNPATLRRVAETLRLGEVGTH
jgi:hypothetical protein